MQPRTSSSAAEALDLHCGSSALYSCVCYVHMSRPVAPELYGLQQTELCRIPNLAVLLHLSLVYCKLICYFILVVGT